MENNGHRENSHRLRARGEGSGASVAHLLDRVTWGETAVEHIENYFRTAAFHCAVGGSTSGGFAQDIGGRIGVGALRGWHFFPVPLREEKKAGRRVRF